MRKMPLFIGALGILTLGTAVSAQDMTMTSPDKPTAAKHQPGKAHKQGVQHGEQSMHEKMMKDHAAGMNAKKTMPDSSVKPAMKMGCCMDKKMKDKPAKAMAMEHDM